jgi:hypothetical protein
VRAAWLFSLYFYFINLAGVKWTFLGKYIWLGELGLGGMGVVWGLDRKWLFPEILGFSALWFDSRPAANGGVSGTAFEINFNGGGQECPPHR